MSQVKLTTNHGAITLKLDAEKAPKTVANFISYVEAGHYNNTIFHRVIKNFMIQGGGMEPGMNQKECQAPIENEAANGLKNKRGSIAMARTNDPHSATAQFFINVVDNDFLDFKAPSGQGWGYCVFGEVTEGMDVVDKIRAVRDSQTLVLAVGTPGDDAIPYLIHNRKREDCRITAAPARAAAGTLVVDPLTAKRLQLSAGSQVRAVPLSAKESKQ